MQDYLLKANIILIVFFLIYRIFFTNDSHFKFSRHLLVSGILFSLILPLIKISFEQETLRSIILQRNLPAIKIIGTERLVSSHNAIHYLSVLYFSILAILSILLFIKILKLIKLNKNSKKEQNIRIISNEYSNFSFFNLIFIREEDYYSDRKNEILLHEQIHAESLHSLDNLLMELICILFWFNPVVWLYRRDLKKVHEFIVDKEIINLGIDSTKYTKMLIEQAVGRSFVVANNFKKSLTLKRLKMMTTQTSNKNHFAKVALTIPVFLLIFLITSVNLNAQNTKVKHNYTLPQYPGGEFVFRQEVANAVVYPKEAIDKNIQGTVFMKITIDEKGNITKTKVIKSTAPILNKAALEAVKKINKKFIPAKQNGKNVKATLTFPIVFTL